MDHAVFHRAFIAHFGPTLAHWQVTLFTTTALALAALAGESVGFPAQCTLKRRIPAYAHDTTRCSRTAWLPPLAQNWLWDNPTVWAVWAKALEEPCLRS